jgi:GT2 family glycosyltransferase
MDPVADIVIVNWNSGRFLRDCIDSIRAFGGDVVRRVVIVDNGSVDDSLDIDIAGLPLDIFQAGKNLGFAKACNLGASGCASPYILFLNPDAALTEGALDKCMAFMQGGAAAQIGICGARLLDERGATQRHCAQFPVWRTYLGRTIGLDGFFPKVFPSNFMREFDHLTSRRVDHVIGAFFLVRRSVFEDLEGFDERFFVYLEDLDFSLRAVRAGWSTWYLAEAVALHKGGGSSQRVKAKRLFYSLRSRMLYAMKHFSKGDAFAVILLTLFIEPVTRLVRAALRGSVQEGWDTLRGYAMVWKAVPELFRSGPDRNPLKTTRGG